MVATPSSGIHFKDPRFLAPTTIVSANCSFYGADTTANGLDTTASFTGFATMGIQDNTNWAANTYKTIYSHTGFGLVYAIIGPKAGGAETTTFEITIDGVLSTLTVNNANTERAILSAQGLANNAGTEFTTALRWLNLTRPLDASTLSTFNGGAAFNGGLMPTLQSAIILGTPMLQYNISCLIRAKHSTIITNTTAEAYSAVMVRKGISA